MADVLTAVFHHFNRVLERGARRIVGKRINFSLQQRNAEFERGGKSFSVSFVPRRHAAIGAGPFLQQRVLLGLGGEAGDLGLGSLVAGGVAEVRAGEIAAGGGAGGEHGNARGQAYGEKLLFHGTPKQAARARLGRA